jgi:hypothetical protein
MLPWASTANYSIYFLFDCSFITEANQIYLAGTYGACGAAGYFTGTFFAGLTAQYTTWAWSVYHGKNINSGR